MQCEITSFDVQEITKGEENILIKIDFYSYLTQNEWSIKRKLKDFVELYSILEKFYVNIPKLPPRLIQPTKILNELNKKKIILNNFLQVNFFLFFRK